MMRQYELVEKVIAYDPDADEDLLNRAYVYAMKAHGSQIRASGDPYFSHPLEVAAILTSLKLDDATIATALLHDTIEDTDTTKTQIDELFGLEIGSLVEGLTKINRLDLITKEAAQAENLRKLLLAISNDIRVLMVKLADRLHNMRTIKHVKPEKRERIARETMDIYAPLAGRMGIQEMRDELEDLSFEILNPKARATIVERLENLRTESGDIVEEITTSLQEKLNDHHINAEVNGREKRPYSIWQKMQRRQLSMRQLSDIFGFRVIVNNVDECYKALGVIHQTWRLVPGRFKDYISTPKQNDYRSIHTTVIGPYHKRVEIQVRTREMHEIAELGIAAHTLYKDNSYSGKEDDDNLELNNKLKKRKQKGSVPMSQDTNAYRWLRKLVEMISESDNPNEFLEHTRLELFHDQVFCFTPGGDLISLPKGAIAIDFAYAVHTAIGNSCVGCRINGNHVSLMSELQNGDEVEIICSKTQTPPAAWESLVITGKARAAIRRHNRVAMREQYADLGYEIFLRAIKDIGLEYNEEKFAKITKRMGIESSSEALTLIGRGELSIREIIAAIAKDSSHDITQNKTAKKPTIRNRFLSWGNVIKFRSTSQKKPEENPITVPVRGSKSKLPMKMADGIGAVPGDRIVGILTPGQGITIYPIHAEALKQFDDEPERWIDLAWDAEEETSSRFPAQISVILINEVGALADVAKIISDNEGNIANLSLVSRAVDFHDLHIEIEVIDLKHLNQIMNAIKKAKAVSRVVRLTDVSQGL